METQPDSSSGFANEPLLRLLKTPTHLMTPEERRKHVMELRQVRVQPQALGKMLREGAEAKKSGGSKRGKIVDDGRVDEEAEQTSGKKSFEDMMKEFGG